MKRSLKYPLFVICMVVSWSIFYAVSKVIVSATGSATFAGFLIRVAALIFLTIQLIADGNFKDLLKQGKAVYILLLIGLFGFLLDLFANLGYAHGSLSTGTALLKTDVLMVNIATVIIYKQKLYGSDWIGTGIMLVGVLMVLGINFKSIELHPTDLFFLLSAAAVSANAFIIKAAQQKYKVNSDMISYYNNFVVLLLFACSATITGDMNFSEINNVPGFWWLVLLGGLGQTGIYFFYYRNLKHFEVWQVKLYLLLMPILSCFIGVLFLGETLTSTKIMGIIIVLIGAAVILLRGKLHPEITSGK